MFKFKLPYFRLTAEGERIKNEIQLMEEYGYYGLESFNSVDIDRSNRMIIKDYEEFKVIDSSLNVMNKILTKDESEQVNNKLKNIFQNKEIVYKELVCPYTNRVVKTFSSSYYGVFFDEINVKIKVRPKFDDSNEELKLKVLKIGYSDMFDLRKNEINSYLRTADISSIYSKEVFELMKSEWGFEKTSNILLNDLEITADLIDFVNVYYKDNTRFEKKKVYLNPKGYRFYRYKGKMIEISSSDIENFDEKLNLIETIGIFAYNSSLTTEYEINTIESIKKIIENNSMSELTKITKIKDIVNSL